jgi:hypothetical protein
MPKFKSPGFKTRQAQRVQAVFDKLDNAGIPMNSRAHRLMAVDAKSGIEPVINHAALRNPCNQIDLGLFGKAVMADFMKRPLFGMGLPDRFLRDPKEVEGMRRGAGIRHYRSDFDAYDHPPKPARWQDTFETPERYLAKLLKRGFKRLGSGAYSTVIGKPGSDKVVKICRRAESDGYPMFAAWAHANPSPYLPRIHSFKRHADWYVVVLDRMEQTVSATSREDGFREATNLLWEYTRNGGARREGAIRKAIMEAVFTSLPGIKDVLEALHKEFDGLAHFDMHDENWMLSKSGQLVLIDPLSGANSEKSKTKNERVSRIKALVRPAA